jgi:hypothetical protein
MHGVFAGGKGMHFLASLITFSGFVFVCCLGLLNVICDLSEMSVHGSPHMPATPHRGPGGAEQGNANANAAYESNPTELSETE